MVIFQTFATELLEPNEAARMYASLATVAENMSADYFEASIRKSGLAIVARDPIDSEWREYSEETGSRHTSKQLLYIARMRRARERLIAEVGSVAFETEFANCHWGVYQMLGKLRPMMYVLGREA
jgi:hypothetical protein